MGADKILFDAMTEALHFTRALAQGRRILGAIWQPDSRAYRQQLRLVISAAREHLAGLTATLDELEAGSEHEPHN